MKKLILLTICISMLQMVSAQTSKKTNFDPNKHGFLFINTFKNALPLDIRTGGLCGGMVYASLDYYNKRMPIPQQDYRPAERTTLQSYIYNRQLNSLTPNLDKWGEVGINPGGARNNEFFEWGLKGFGGGRLQELKEFIDRGQPVPLGLQGAGGDNDGNGHQVLAIGYDMGRYKGDLGNYKTDFKIFVYDPNYPKTIKTLVPDLAKKVFHYNTGTRKEWRTYFVDKKYSAKSPPVIPNRNFPKDGKIYELIIEFCTGNDDLRGGNDNLNLVINNYDRTNQTVNNANLSANWMRDYSQFVCVPLKKPVLPKDLKSMDMITTFRGGIDGDNWDLKDIIIRGIGGNVDQTLYKKYESFGGMAHRFTGESKKHTVTINKNPPIALGNKINSFNFTFLTGSDDLRGGKDNVNISIYYTNGTKQDEMNINNGSKWRDNSTNIVSINLNRDVLRSEIAKIVISTTASGGMGGDNWNLNKLVIQAKEGSVYKTFYNRNGKPLNRFTGERRTFTVRL